MSTEAGGEAGLPHGAFAQVGGHTPGNSILGHETHSIPAGANFPLSLPRCFPSAGTGFAAKRIATSNGPLSAFTTHPAAAQAPSRILAEG